MPELDDTVKDAIADLKRMEADGWAYTLTLGSAEAFALVSMLQVVLKHPPTGGPAWVITSTNEIARSIERAVGQTGAIQEILREGWLPE